MNFLELYVEVVGNSLSNVYRIASVVSTSSVVCFSFVLLAWEAIVQQQQILLCGVKC